MNDYKVKERILYHTYDGRYLECIIEEIRILEHKTVYLLFDPTQDDFYTAYESEISKLYFKVSQYKNYMKNLAWLLCFPIDHDIRKDDDALRAYKVRAKELTGITLDEVQS